jgi:hypothetical protein
VLSNNLQVLHIICTIYNSIPLGCMLHMISNTVKKQLFLCNTTVTEASMGICKVIICLMYVRQKSTNIYERSSTASFSNYSFMFVSDENTVVHNITPLTVSQCLLCHLQVTSHWVIITKHHTKQLDLFLLNKFQKARQASSADFSCRWL